MKNFSIQNNLVNIEGIDILFMYYSGFLDMNAKTKFQFMCTLKLTSFTQGLIDLYMYMSGLTWARRPSRGQQEWGSTGSWSTAMTGL